ncbi:response regulator [Planktotalea sp.]|uniref:response regulator n=1 Tax=Planktotalea sp. TaxID=2029877 RepID=UPI003F6C8905
MNELEYTSLTPAATATRPLLGLTILVVEDSRFACDAMRLLCLRSGARIRRADCLRSARRHLQVYRPSVAIIDLGLPDGSGAELIKELAGSEPRIHSLLAISGDDTKKDLSLEAGADGFLSKPLSSLANFQTAVLHSLPEDMRPSGLRSITDEEVDPDPLAYRDDMAHASEMLSDDADLMRLDYAAQFLRGVAKSARDEPLREAAQLLAKATATGTTVHSHQAKLAGLVRQRLSEQAAI